MAASMTMRKARWWVAIIGIALPYLARLPGGLDWLQQYTNTEMGLAAQLFLGMFNAIAWGSIVAISFLYRHAVSLLAPALLGFGFLAWAHATLDLAGDAQAGIGLVFIPIYALLPIAIGGVIGFVVDRWLRRRDPVKPGSS